MGGDGEVPLLLCRHLAAVAAACADVTAAATQVQAAIAGQAVAAALTALTAVVV